MARWSNVRWTEAGQVAETIGWSDFPLNSAHAAPETFADELRRQGRLMEAVQFLAHALPRFETVAWAARTVRDLPRRAAARGDEHQRAALRCALLWLQDPSETRRRAARAAADAVQTGGPERFAALAAFYSGGSLAPETCQPVPAPKGVTGRLASGAVLLAAEQCEDMKAALHTALDMGERIAVDGLTAGAE